MANGRSFLRVKKKEAGRHQAYEQVLDGEYAFRPAPVAQSPLEAYNAATKELQDLIRACLQEGKSLHARGSLWSLSTAAVTDGRLIDTTALCAMIGVPKALTDDRYGGEAGKLRFVECGTTIAALNDHLFAAGLSLKTSGSSNGQTLAGALSTGTHGGAYRFGAIQEMVVGLHLIVGPDKHIYLERQSNPVTTPAFARSLGAEFKQDDTLFNAALVSFGSFGILHGIMIETRDLFALNAIRFKRRYDSTMKAAITACDPTIIPLPAAADGVLLDRPHHFELFFNPNESETPENASVLVMYEQDQDATAYAPPVSDDRMTGLGASGLDVVGALANRLPDAASTLTASMLNSAVDNALAPSLEKAVIRDLFRGEEIQSKILAAGVGMPAGRAVEAVEIAFKVYRDGAEILPLLLSCRFAKGTKALLGFTRFGSTAVFEMNALNTPKSRAYLHRVCAAFDAAGLPFTLHWGKFNAFLTAARLRTCYGNTATNQWIASREALLESPTVRDVFANEFITNLGLAT